MTAALPQPAFSSVTPQEREAIRRREAYLARRPYKPYGAAHQMWCCRDPEILLEGPAGTGKSRAILEKINLACMKYPGMRALIVRATKESMAESVLVTFEERVMPAGSPIVEGPNRHNRQFYTYPNGSTIVVGGLDKSSKIMSTEYDLIAVFEATEVDKESFEDLTTRLRNFVMPYQQIIADCNPDQPFHWLNLRPEEPDEDPQRAGCRKMTRFLSRHEDNPTLWDRAQGCWTDRGAKYIAKLDGLTGAKKQRLRYGRWVAAEGAVYEDEWDPRRHVIRMALPGERHDPNAYTFDPRRVAMWLGSIDWGFRNPGVFCVWAVDNDGNMILVRQIYRRGRTMPWWITQIQRVSREYPFAVPGKGKGIVADPSEPGNISELRAAGFVVREAANDVKLGIEHVRDRLAPVDGGPPRLYVLENNLLEVDEELKDEGKPWALEQEFGVYLYPKGQDGKPIKEDPVKQHDHGMDAMRYAAMDADGQVRRRTGRPVVQPTGLRAISARRKKKPWEGR